MHEILSSKNLPRPQFKYSPLLRAGSFYFTAGMLGVDLASNKIEDHGPLKEAQKILSNLQNALPDFDLDIKHLVSAKIYTTDMERFSLINQAWDEFFGDSHNLPVRTSIGVLKLPLDACVEMEFVFHKDQ